MASSNSIVFYDIKSGPPLRTIAPNPWKTRYALNFKRLPYQTNWVDMPDIASVCKELGVPANRTHRDGAPYHTLPAIQDPSTGKVIGDSFEIALYLDKIYPESPVLIHPGTTGLTAAFNAQVDTIKCPLTRPSVEKIMEIFAKRAAAMGRESLQLSAEDREKMFVQFERALGEFVKAYYHVGGTTDYMIHEHGTAAAQAQRSGRAQIGPYLDGDRPAYADLIVGAWLCMMEVSMKQEDWQRVRTWQDGFWGRLHDALAPLREIK